ncbi:unnamed protein product [Brachionus calyciflorus]|uniref:Uncharacterized protein n=1 Tax=Brachionus calyciflorus TaxID=104777 RepID=A0A813NTG7_9BILA|nr:unnamed protein product [Brachionus calyciflorus]
MTQPRQRVQRVITLLGSTSVGKSTLCTRFIGKEFSNEYEPTIRNLFQLKKIQNGTEYDLQIQDTAGLERHAQINGHYINSDGFILVYSTTDYQSFETVIDIFNSLADELNREIPLVLIGNKSDLIDKRKVPYASGESLARKWRAAFYETSALDGKNVKNSFEALLDLIDPPVQSTISTQNGSINKKLSSNVNASHSSNHYNPPGLTTTSSNSNKNSCIIS